MWWIFNCLCIAAKQRNICPSKNYKMTAKYTVQ